MRLMMLHAVAHFLSLPCRCWGLCASSTVSVCTEGSQERGSVTRVTCSVKRKELRDWHFMSKRRGTGITQEMMSKQRKTAIEQKPSLKRYPADIVSCSQPALCVLLPPTTLVPVFFFPASSLLPVALLQTINQEAKQIFVCVLVN